MTNKEFINQIAPIIQKECKERGYKYPSAIIAQAILESGWGNSLLASKYYNYFGLKCGTKWQGKSVNMSTNEEYTTGTLTNIRDNFRVFDNMKEGVKGYFDFIGYNRYANLKQATSSLNYLKLIKQDGYATSSKYVDNLYNVILQNNLMEWDNMKNNEPTNSTVGLEKAIDTIAEYVINGAFGNGETRKETIYKMVQDRVNEKLKR